MGGPCCIGLWTRREFGGNSAGILVKPWRTRLLRGAIWSVGLVCSTTMGRSREFNGAWAILSIVKR